MPSVIGTQVGGADAGVTVGANYLRVLQSPGAALAGLDANGSYPLVTFNTPNLRMFKVVVTDEDLVTDANLSNSSWSKVVRALQVTSEVFAIFAPAVTEGDSTFCFMAPDFNTNAGAVASSADTGKVQPAIAQGGGGFSILETAITDAVGGTCTVTKVALTGTTVA
jgi:hypothetical protein